MAITTLQRNLTRYVPTSPSAIGSVRALALVLVVILIGILPL
jgi:hypothetical protein